MKDGIGSNLIDRRFFLGAAAGGSAVALLDFLDLIEIGDAGPGVVVRVLRRQLAGDPALPSFIVSASDALNQHASEWSDAPISTRKLTKLSVAEIKAMVRDDYKNNRTVSVLGWIVSRTEAALLTVL